MKKYLFILASLVTASACQQKPELPDTLPFKVAKAYGIENFDQINSIAYTWNVQRDSVNVISRDWKWNIKDRTVYYADADTSYTYSLDLPKEELPKAEKDQTRIF